MKVQLQAMSGVEPRIGGHEGLMVGGHWTYRHLTYDTVGVHRSDVCFR